MIVWFGVICLTQQTHISALFSPLGDRLVKEIGNPHYGVNFSNTCFTLQGAVIARSSHAILLLLLCWTYLLTTALSFALYR